LVGEGTIRLNAETIIVSLSSSMSPARTTVRLVTDVVNDGCALGPVDSSIELFRRGNRTIGNEMGTFFTVDGPFGINDSSHNSLNLLERGVGELGVNTSSPGGLRVVVDGIDVGLEHKGSFGLEHLHDVNSRSLTHVESLASSFSILKVDISNLGIDGFDSLL